VILLHGGGAGVSAVDNWHQSIGPIADAGFSVYAPEMIGFGMTDKPTDGNTVDAKVRHVKDFIDLLCLDKVGLIGNSLGGRVALGIALDWPTRIKRLVLTGSAGMRLEPSPMLKQLISYTPSKQKMRQLVEALFHDPSLVTDQMIESRYQLSLLPGAQEAFEGFFKAASDPKHRGAMDIEDKLPQIQTPALLIWGKQDRAIPVEVGKWMAELLPNARLKVLDNCGHWTQLEQTQKFNQLVINFITGNQPEGLSR
jgi:pimeloyl-ACP methyl ester carboxylesterase